MGKIKYFKILFIFSVHVLGCQSFDKATEICDDGIDNDANGYYDCADSACATNPACQFTNNTNNTNNVNNTNNTNNQNMETICDDGDDNDGDGYIDCDDPDCADNMACIETNCADSIDDDGDGDTDCADPDCLSDPYCVEFDCNDGFTNDNDDFIDCDDTDCVDANKCEEYDCSDGIDNDNDGEKDCYDSECFFDHSCGGKEHYCDNDADDDGDGFQDCEDPDCADSCIEICNDGNDNDANGLIDCADPACACAAGCTPPAEETNCSDGIDNNCDSLVDCEDQFCIGNPVCKCNIVNIFWDSEGYTDCVDPDVCSYYEEYDEANNHPECMDLDSSNLGYYEACDQRNICSKGSICTINIGDVGNNYTCVPLCQKEAHPSCPDDGNGYFGVCLGNFAYDELSYCVLPDNCNLLDPNDCELGVCYIMSVESANSDLLTICHQAGNKDIWDHCIQGNFECIAGSQCLATHLGYRCAPFCYDEMDCNSGQICHQIGNNFGYCFFDPTN
jgi:hypothetical protein